MATCAQCGVGNDGVVELCGHHFMIYGENWAAANRIWCDFFHRGEPIPRLTVVDRETDFWNNA